MKAADPGVDRAGRRVRGGPFAPVPAAELTDTHGARVTVRRAWPQRKGELTVEAVEMSSGALRGGVMDAHGYCVLSEHGIDPSMPALAAAAEDGQLLVHRYKRRAVVRSRDGRRYLKLLPPGKSGQVADAARAMGALAEAAAMVSPRVLAVHADRVVFSAIPGRSLHEIGRSLGGDLAWGRAWQSWPALVRTASTGIDLPRYSAEDEAGTVRRWAAGAIDHEALTLAPSALNQLADAVSAGLLNSAAGPEGVSHRDLHDKQLLYCGDSPSKTERLGLLDFDTAAIAESALDLANLKVHLEFRRAQGQLSIQRYRIGAQTIAEVVSTLRVPPDRMAAYEASTRLRLACVYAFRPSWRGLANRWAQQLVGRQS